MYILVTYHYYKRLEQLLTEKTEATQLIYHLLYV